MEAPEIRLNDFAPSDNTPFPTILLCGKRASGKSILAASVAKRFSHIPRWVAFVGTKATGEYWGSKFGSPATVHGCDRRATAKLEEIVRYQEHKVETYKNIFEKEMPQKYYLGLIFDDVTSKREFRRAPILEDLFSNGRHYKILILICVQYIKQLPPAVRMNSDYLIMLHNSRRVLRLLHEDYVGVMEFDIFARLVEHVTGERDPETNEKKYNALVFDNTMSSGKISNIFSVFRYPTGTDPTQIKLGDEKWHTFNKVFYRDDKLQKAQAQYANETKQQRLSLYNDSITRRRKVQSENTFVLSKGKRRQTSYKFRFTKHT